MGTLLSRAVSLVSSILVARCLGKETFGEFAVLQSTVGMFGVFAGFGMGMTAARYVAELRLRDPVRAGRLMGLSTLLALFTGGAMAMLLFFVANPIADRALAAPKLTPYLRLCAPLLLLGALNGAQLGALMGLEAFRRITLVNMLSAVASLPLVAIGAWRLDLAGAVSGLTLGQAISCWLTEAAIRKETANAQIKVRFRGVWSEARVVWRFSVPSVVTGVLTVPVNWACIGMLANTPGGYGETAVFNVANQWRGLVMLVPNALINFSLPILSSFTGVSDEAGRNRVSRATAVGNFALTLLLALIVGSVSPHILNMYGVGYGGGETCVWILALSAVPGSYAWAKYQVLASRGQMWANAVIMAAWASAFLMLACLLVPVFRSAGLALATLLGQLAYAAVLAGYLRCPPADRPLPRN